APRLREPDEALAVAGRAGQTRARVAEHIQTQPLAGRLANRDERRPAIVGRADHAALPDQLPSDLELRLYERQAVEARRRRAHHRAEQLRERDEGDVDRDQVRREGKLAARERPGVLAL